MIPMAILSAAFPSHQIAGHAGVSVAGVLLPPGEKAGHYGVRVCSIGDLSDPSEVAALFQREAPASVSLGDPEHHLLVVRPRGEFESLDRLALARFQAGEDRWLIELEITRAESGNLEPAPRDLFVFVSLVVGEQRRPRRIAFEFRGRRLGMDGAAIPFADPVAPPETMEIGG